MWRMASFAACTASAGGLTFFFPIPNTIKIRYLSTAVTYRRSSTKYPRTSVHEGRGCWCALGTAVHDMTVLLSVSPSMMKKRPRHRAARAGVNPLTHPAAMNWRDMIIAPRSCARISQVAQLWCGKHRKTDAANWSGTVTQHISDARDGGLSAWLMAWFPEK